MSYCINPQCLQRKNPDYLNDCKACGTPLCIQGCYRLTQPLRSLKCSRYVEVFEVEDNQHCHKVLKILKTNYEELTQLFIREAKVLSWLDHNGIPKVEPEPDGYFLLSPIENVNLHCIVMEKIEGQTLSQWLTQHKKLDSVDLTLKWLKDLTQILEQVHQNNLFHRDIKPSNIIRRSNGQLALIDFGAVKQTMEVLDGQEKLSNILTLGYAPPEQFDRQAVPQSDFFALGRTFAHLLTGQHPIDIEEIDDRLVWRPYLPENLPPLLLDLIDDLMHPSVNDRPNSTTEIQQRLDHIFHIWIASPTATKPFLLKSSKPKKKFFWSITAVPEWFRFIMIINAVPLLVMIVLGMWWVAWWCTNNWPWNSTEPVSSLAAQSLETVANGCITSTFSQPRQLRDEFYRSSEDFDLDSIKVGETFSVRVFRENENEEKNYDIQFDLKKDVRDKNFDYFDGLLIKGMKTGFYKRVRNHSFNEVYIASPENAGKSSFAIEFCRLELKQ